MDSGLFFLGLMIILGTFFGAFLYSRGGEHRELPADPGEAMAQAMIEELRSGAK